MTHATVHCRAASGLALVCAIAAPAAHADATLDKIKQRGKRMVGVMTPTPLLYQLHKKFKKTPA